MSRPRLLTIMGSGETSPTMAKTHRRLLERLGPPPVPAVLLDTPFGFQANAGDLTAKAQEYFRDSVGHPIGVASYMAPDPDPVAYESMLARLREAQYVFAGPGSPTYALRVWRGSLVPDALATKLRSGGAVTFASAAALTLGAAAVPVYEIYKVGAEPAWLEGLDLLEAIGLPAVVIPHYNNAEGRNHDTRFCYLGEPRLARMERDLPAGSFILGVDEHTGLILDLDAGTAEVVGIGTVTIRKDGASAVLETGTTVALEALRPGGRGPGAGAGSAGAVGTRAEAGTVRVTGDPSALLHDEVTRAEAAFGAALAARDVTGAVRAVLDLDRALQAWSQDSLQSDEMDKARSVLRSMIVRLGELAETGVQDPAEAIGPFIEVLLGVRAEAREAGRYEDADRVRDRLVELGVEVQDARGSSAWRLLP